MAGVYGDDSCSSSEISPRCLGTMSVDGSFCDSFKGGRELPLSASSTTGAVDASRLERRRRGKERRQQRHRARVLKRLLGSTMASPRGCAEEDGGWSRLQYVDGSQQQRQEKEEAAVVSRQADRDLLLLLQPEERQQQQRRIWGRRRHRQLVADSQFVVAAEAEADLAEAATRLGLRPWNDDEALRVPLAPLDATSYAAVAAVETHADEKRPLVAAAARCSHHHVFPAAASASSEDDPPEMQRRSRLPRSGGSEACLDGSTRRASGVDEPLPSDWYHHSHSSQHSSRCGLAPAAASLSPRGSGPSAASSAPSVCPLSF
ncbi:hypothetical protein cyc_08976 [Cyclospora cayetanensis]|uniref:Uncharacterized protein n=1 Tax=Cyclospora cayetanensis TaxID=88456 RepID=A0A1D3DA69_9EIME|nr:hypothetical protein cyc_08976 [Cyclospora cayetanensis]